MPRKAPHFGWYGVLAALGLAVLLLALAWLRLPAWAGRLAERALREHGVEVRAFGVERIGFATTKLGAAELGTAGLGFGWESARLEYRPGGLLAGRLERVAVARPAVELDLAALLALPGALAGEQPAPAPRAAPPRLPFGDLVMEDGRLRLVLPGGAAVQAGWEARLLDRFGRLDGHFALAGEGVAATLALNGSAAAGFTASASAEFGPLLQQQLAAWAMAGLEAPPELVFTGGMAADALYETGGEGVPRASFQASLDGLRVLLPRLPQALALDDWRIAGTLVGEEWSVHGGLRVGPLAGKDWRTDAFGARLHLGAPAALRLETESFAWRFGAWNGRCALRGHALRDGEGRPSGAVEAACSAVAGPGIAADAFSLHLQADADAVVVRLSPLGLRRATTLWLEDGAGRLDLRTGAASGAFAWFNAAGAAMGSVTLHATAGDEGRQLAELTLADATGAVLLTAAGSRAGGQSAVSVSGALPVAWLNALNRWWDAAPAHLTGADPRIDAHLEGAWPRWRGSIRLAVPGTNVRLDSGAVLEGVEADWRFRVDGLPASDGTQTLRVRAVRGAGAELRDLQAVWRMPNIRQLEVGELTAHFMGGRVRAEPFSLDPLEPVLDTRLHIAGLPAAALLELLGEKRFSLDGPLNGSLRLGWRDGALLLGQGLLQLAAARPDQRFRFLDQAFVRDSFGALGGVPPELRDRFLEALLQEGIQIHSLELAFEPATQPGMVLLRIVLSGATRTDRLEVPIRGFVINNRISEADLGRLLGLLGPVRIFPQP